MAEKRSCKNCLKGMNIRINDDILCRDRGVVSTSYVCRQHRFAPESKSVAAIMPNSCIDCQNFIMDTNNSDFIGLCRLFSVRKYNGKERKACSKFSRCNNQQEVS